MRSRRRSLSDDIISQYPSVRRASSLRPSVTCLLPATSSSSSLTLIPSTTSSLNVHPRAFPHVTSSTQVLPLNNVSRPPNPTTVPSRAVSPAQLLPSSNPLPIPNSTITPPPTTARKMALPLPGSDKVLCFTGKRPDEFIQSIEILGKNASLADVEWPKLVRRYCSSNMKDVLVSHDEFDKNDWKKATEVLLYYYGKEKRYERAMPEGLQTFSDDSSLKCVQSRDDVDSYIRGFTKAAATLVADKKVTEAERDRLFYRGFHKDIRERIKPELSQMARDEQKEMNSTKPPPMARTTNVVRGLFSKSEIDYDGTKERGRSSYRHRGCSSRSLSGSSDESSISRSHSRECMSKGRSRNISSSDSRSCSRTPKRFHRRCHSRSHSTSSSNDNRNKSYKKTKTKRRHSPPRPSSDSNHLDSVVKSLANTISQIGLVVQQQQQVQQHSLNNTPILYAAPASSSQQQGDFCLQQYGERPTFPRRCFGCDKVKNQNLEHRLGMNFCLEILELVSSGQLKFDSPTNRFIHPDSSEPARPLNGTGGIAAALRRERAFNRKQAPHMAMAITLCKDEDNLLTSNVYAASADISYSSYPVVTRVQTKHPTARLDSDSDSDHHSAIRKQVRFQEHRRLPENKKPLFQYRRDFDTFQPSRDEMTFSPATEAAQKPPSAPHPVNTKQGWEKTQADRRDADNDKFYTKPKPPYHFTSDIQKTISSDEIQSRVLDTPLSMTVREVLGISPDLQKCFAGLTKTKREFNSRQTCLDTVATILDTLHTVIEPVNLADVEDDIKCATAVVKVAPHENENEIMKRYDNSVILSAKKLLGRQAGIVKGLFGKEEVTFLVDTGSEMNLITKRVWERSQVPIESDGNRWSLKGLGDQPVALLGCCLDAPLQIGGKNFDHHFFVSTREHGQYDGILGAPWLQWFSAEISFHRMGPTYLTAYPSGDKTGPFAQEAICQTRNPRDQDKLVFAASLNQDKQPFSEDF
ncbi:hypothetical protein ABKN59_008346 [Abortiporus biennis]